MSFLAAVRDSKPSNGRNGKGAGTGRSRLAEAYAGLCRATDCPPRFPSHPRCRSSRPMRRLRYSQPLSIDPQSDSERSSRPSRPTFEGRIRPLDIDWVNCIRGALATKGINFELPNQGAIANARVSWTLLRGGPNVEKRDTGIVGLKPRRDSYRTDGDGRARIVLEGVAQGVRSATTGNRGGGP